MNWKSKKVLVTGADGFIGSHLAEELVRQGADVRTFCIYNSQGTRGWLEQSDPEVQSAFDVRLGDIRDARFVEESCRDIEVVFHLAALIAIPYSYQAPQSFVDTNITGTLNVLEAARKCAVGIVVQTSTSEVYGTPATLPITEDHPLNAQSPYAATKVASDQLALSFHRSFQVPVTILRPFNTYGPRQSARAVTVAILTQLLSGKEEISLGRLDTRRDMTYVSDVVQGFLQAASMPEAVGQVIQLGTGRAVSIGELFEMACKVTGKSARVLLDERRLRPDASEVMVLLSNPQKAREQLLWTPQVELEEGLEKTARWIQSNVHYYRPNSLVL